jgi:hypothetical protein
MDETLSATLRFHAERVEFAAEALDRALGEACQEIERVLRHAGLGHVKLTAPVPYLGPEGDYHAQLEAVRADADGGLVFVDDSGETVDAQSVGSEALKAALGLIDLRAAVAMA